MCAYFLHGAVFLCGAQVKETLARMIGMGEAVGKDICSYDASKMLQDVEKAVESGTVQTFDFPSAKVSQELPGRYREGNRSFDKLPRPVNDAFTLSDGVFAGDFLGRRGMEFHEDTVHGRHDYMT